MKKHKSISRIALLMALAMLATTLFACKPSVEDRALEYLSKYDDNFTLIDQKELSNSKTFTFSSENYPDKKVTVRYEAMFDTDGQNPFCDNYMSIRFAEENNLTGKRIIDDALPGENCEMVATQGALAKYYNKDTTYEEYYSNEGIFIGVILHKQPTEAVLDADLAAIEEVVKNEDERIANDYAPIYVKVLYVSYDDTVLETPSIEAFEGFKDYDAILNLQYLKANGACEVKESEIK